MGNKYTVQLNISNSSQFKFLPTLCRKKTLVQAILGIVVIGILTWIIFRFFVPSMQSSFDNRPIET